MHTKKNSLPKEVVNIIIDYIDYEKYGKINSKKLFYYVLNDLLNASSIFVCDNNNLPPNTIKLCWGIGIKKNEFDFFSQTIFD